MERKEFLKHTISALGIITIAPLLPSCSKNDAVDGKGNNPGNPPGGMPGGTGSASEVDPDTSCTDTPSETEGPFPTHNPDKYVKSDIRKGDGVGAALISTITIVDTANNCKPLEKVYVDIWHCDVKGEYSEYGGTQMQKDDYTEVHWLRGRQLTDAKGQVKFTSIFPGWYQGRATHIHAHIFDQSGNTLLVTQIAFQDALCNTVNTNGKDYGYTSGMTGYTYNNADNVFSDGFAKEMSVVTGSLKKGFELTHTIHV